MKKRSTRVSENPAATARRRNATLPAYHRLYVLLAAGIRDGRYPPGDLLPPENTLAQRHEVSRVTVRKALQQLAEDGLIDKRHGQGNLVKLTRRDEKPVSGLIANLVAQGLTFEAKTLAWESTVAGEEVAQHLELDAGEACLLVRRLRSLHGNPIGYASIYLPGDVGKLLKRRSAATRLVLQELDTTPHAPAYTEHTLSATLADGEAADSLGVASGSPLLRMRGVAYTREGRAVYYQDSVYHPDRYEYTVQLSRAPGTRDLLWKSSG